MSNGPITSMKQAMYSLVFLCCPSNFWKFGTVYPTGHDLAAVEARYDGLRLRHAVVEEAFSFSHQIRASTSALVTKIVGSSTTLTGL